MKYNSEQIGKTILSERKRIGKTQESLAKDLNMVGKQISNYEKGALIPPISVLLKLCEVFHCELGYLLGEPDYAEGTKLETAIVDYTGLNMDSLKNIRKITGTEESCLNFGYESDAFRAVLNSLLSSKGFLTLVESLEELNSMISKRDNVLPRLKSAIGQELFNQVIDFEQGPIDYIYDPNAPKLSDEQYDAIKKYHSAEEELENIAFNIKVLRYELFEAFQSLISELYPQKE